MKVNILKSFDIKNPITVLVLDVDIDLAGKKHCTIDNIRYEIPHSHNIAKNILPIVGSFNKTGQVELALE